MLFELRRFWIVEILRSFISKTTIGRELVLLLTVFNILASSWLQARLIVKSTIRPSDEYGHNGEENRGFKEKKQGWWNTYCKKDVKKRLIVDGMKRKCCQFWCYTTCFSAWSGVGKISNFVRASRKTICRPID